MCVNPEGSSVCIRLEVLWCGSSLMMPFGTFHNTHCIELDVCCVCLFVSVYNGSTGDTQQSAHS